MPRKGRQLGAKGRPESRLRNGAELRACLVCGAEFWVSRWQRETVKGGGRYCSRSCKHQGVSAVLKGRPKVDGLVRHSAGYLLEWAPDHPRAGKRGRVFRHILVAERTLGRHLVGDEQVHHINGVVDDNRPENLQVMTASEHKRHHASQPKEREANSARARQKPQRRDPATGRFTQT